MATPPPTQPKGPPLIITTISYLNFVGIN